MSIEAMWSFLSYANTPDQQVQCFQKAWDAPIMKKLSRAIDTSAKSDVEQSLTKSGLFPHSEDWLQAPPIASVGLLLSDEEIRLVVAYRLYTRACSSYTCTCGKAVDARRSCRRSTPHHQCHSMINNIIWRAIKRAKILTYKEPTGLMIQNSKHPDGATLISWSRSKALAWDITIPDTYAVSHHQSTAIEAGSAVNHAAEMKCTKYRELDATHIFILIAIETAGTWDIQAVKLVEEIGRWCTLQTDDPKETIYLYQCIAIAIQRGNALSFTHTFDIDIDINT